MLVQAITVCLSRVSWEEDSGGRQLINRLNKQIFYGLKLKLTNFLNFRHKVLKNQFSIIIEETLFFGIEKHFLHLNIIQMMKKRVKCGKKEIKNVHLQVQCKLKQMIKYLTTKTISCGIVIFNHIINMSKSLKLLTRKDWNQW